MAYKLSGCTFVRNIFDGGWPSFESMLSVLPLVDEYVVLDLGSTDNTVDAYCELAAKNKKIKLELGNFSCIDAKAFADAANDAVFLCKNNNVLFHQSDEIFHEDLVKLMRERFDRNEFNLSFWRYHLKYNAQEIRQYPQRVHRVGQKERFNFVDDGMNSSSVGEAPLCSHFHGGWYMKWGEWFKNDPPYLPTWEMIFDCGLIGMFRGNVKRRKEMHQPFWRDGMSMPKWVDGVEGRIAWEEWEAEHAANPQWTAKTSPFNIPELAKGLLGMEKYELRNEIKERIINA